MTALLATKIEKLYDLCTVFGVMADYQGHQVAKVASRFSVLTKENHQPTQKELGLGYNPTETSSGDKFIDFLNNLFKPLFHPIPAPRRKMIFKIAVNSTGNVRITSFKGFEKQGEAIFETCQNIFESSVTWEHKENKNEWQNDIYSNADYLN